jgi:hypothetical protein
MRSRNLSRALWCAAILIFASLAAGAWQSPAQQPAAAAGASGACPPGHTGSPATGCVDVNECAVNNGGCHKLSACRNTPGSRTCSSCPPDFAGDGYVGCFDVNECPAGDCSDRIPTGAEKATPPTVTTSGDVTVTATSEAGAPATFTVSAKDAIDGARPAHCLPRSGSTFPIGTSTVSCWSINSVGKIGRATLTVTVSKAQFE